MGISRVVIKNFRCFQDADFLFEKCHALIGENGCGKTTVLEAINLATSSGYPYISEQDFNNADAGDLEIKVFFDEPFLCKIPDGYYTRDILCEGVVFSAHRRKKAASGRALSDPFVTEKHAIPLTYSAQSKLKDVDFDKLNGNIPDSVIQTDKGYESPRKTGSAFKFTTQRLSLQNEMINYPNIFYFNRGRESEARVGFNSLLTKIIKDLNWRYRDKWDQDEIIKKWDDFYDKVISTVIAKKNDRIMKPLGEKMREMVGLEYNNLELSLLDIEQPFSKAFFSLREGSNQIEQRNLGSGIAILIAFFLLQTISNLAEGEIVFLIDEPELHLHPQLQIKLFDEFHSSISQIIYTTQSDCFVSIAEWKSITRIDMNFKSNPSYKTLNDMLEGRKVFEHLNEIKKFHQHKVIFFREDNQIFFSKKCLIVEGPAEKYGLPILASKTNKKFSNLTIISANGKAKIPYYQLLCKSFGIPYFTLVDLDGKTQSDSENKRSCESAESNALAVFDKSFEEELGIPRDTDHKASKVLAKIDDLSVDAITGSIENNIDVICAWC